MTSKTARSTHTAPCVEFDNAYDDLHEHPTEWPDKVSVEPNLPHPAADPIETSTEPRPAHPERMGRPSGRTRGGRATR